MPEYLPELVDVIRRKREALTNRIDIEIECTWADILGESAKSNWNQLPVEEKSPPPDVVGSDGSQSERVLWNGSVWWIVRAVAISGNQRIRLLDTGFTQSGVSEQDFRWYLGTKMGDLENKAAFKGVKDLRGKWILLDGSLFGRLQMLPIESAIIGDRFVHLDYYETILDLLEYCRRNRIGVISISKDSRVRHFVRFLIFEKIQELMKSSSLKLSLAKRQLINNETLSPSTILENTSLMDELAGSGDKAQQKIADLLHMAVQPLPDHVLMQHMIKGKGYTSPVLLNMTEAARNSLKSAFKNSSHYISTRFKQSLRETENKQALRKRLSKLLVRLEEIPSIVSFHTRLHPQDTPLRVDIPGWMANIDKQIWKPERPERIGCDLTEVFRVLTGGYGGLQNYNIWQKRADELARLSRDTVDNLYRQAVEKELGIRIDFERGYRRVYYP